jgi:biopolymer transport protein TolR
MRSLNKRPRRRAIADINIVPYIDVMLVLLVIFMITTPLLSQGVKVDLPHAKANPIETKQQLPIIVTVDEQGHYYVNTEGEEQNPLTAEQLSIRVAAQLKVAQQSRDTRQVLVRGDRNVPYGKVVQVMGLLQNAGVAQVGLMTDSSLAIGRSADAAQADK